MKLGTGMLVWFSVYLSMAGADISLGWIIVTFVVTGAINLVDAACDRKADRQLREPTKNDR